MLFKQQTTSLVCERSGWWNVGYHRITECSSRIILEHMAWDYVQKVLEYPLSRPAWLCKNTCNNWLPNCVFGLYSWTRLVLKWWGQAYAFFKMSVHVNKLRKYKPLVHYKRGKRKGSGERLISFVVHHLGW